MSAPLEVTHSEPSCLLVGSWYGDTLRFELSPDGDSCVFVFTHSFSEIGRAAFAQHHTRQAEEG